MQKVIGLLFTYIQLLQQSGVSQWIFDELTLAGFIHKLRILLETVIQKIANFEVKPDRFSVIKETVTKAYQNYKFIQPNHQAKYYCSLVLQDQAWPWTEELDALSHLEAQDLAKSVPVMLSRTFLECYIAGNVEKNEAESMVNGQIILVPSRRLKP
uniref:Zinc-metallopeptidase, peroxisomal n=1 Tax=Noccaea caerulescens TaxID=107243 RepID=A0A1J3K221_NOCCA